jgi:ribonucleoside-diphosphate reductase beta chain
MDPKTSSYRYSTFQTTQNNQLTEPMFLGNAVNVARYDQQKYTIFERLTEKQLSFFWRPEEIDLSRDRIDYTNFSDSEKHIFLSNLKYQTLLDSVQGRGPNVALLPLVSLPELETWVETWSFFETIHSRSYTHMVRSMLDDPSIVFDDIVKNEEIKKRAIDITKYYDDLIYKTQLFQALGESAVNRYELKKALYLALHAVNALEAIRFYASFACTFAFSEGKKIEGCGKIMKLIARDEALHQNGTRQMINLLRLNNDDPQLYQISVEVEHEAKEIFLAVIKQEKAWAKYLFKHGSILGLNEMILCQYIDYIAKERMEVVGFTYENKSIPKSNPIPWIDNYLQSDNVQVAPQEVENSSYLVGQIDSAINSQELSKFFL